MKDFIIEKLNTLKVKNNDKEEILPYTSLTDEEKEKLNNPNDKSITLDHKELKGMNIIELYDCKDTTMEQKDYRQLELPALLLFDYQDIYNSFVKALYAMQHALSSPKNGCFLPKIRRRQNFHPTNS